MQFENTSICATCSCGAEIKIQAIFTGKAKIILETWQEYHKSCQEKKCATATLDGQTSAHYIIH